MARVFDVARYILRRKGEMTAMKLQKLVYYAQAWSLVWDEQPLFPERIEAWAQGPVVPELYGRHRGQFRVDENIVPDGDPNALLDHQRETVDKVIEFYGVHSAQWLSDLSHLERPWASARERAHVAAGDYCQEEIRLADMAEYYSGLMNDASAQTVA